MKQFAFKSIKGRLASWFLILSLIPLLLVLYITYNQQVSVIQRETFEKLEAIRDLKVIHLKTWLRERKGDIRTISQDKDLTELEEVFNKKHLGENKIRILSNCNRLLNHYLNNYSGYSEIFIINSQTGIVEISTDENSVGSDKSNDLYFTQILQNKDLYIKDIHFLNGEENDIQMNFSIPIFISKDDDNSKIIGILVTRIDLQNSLFKILLERTGLGETGETLIVNKEGYALNELRFWEDAPLKLKIKGEPAILASQGETGIKVTTDYRKANILAAYTYIPETGWGFVSKQDLYELYSPIREMIRNFILIFIVTAMAITLLAFGISKSISKPIVELSKSAQKIGAGDFSARNTVVSEDESGSLARELNKMAEILETRVKTEKGVAAISDTIIGNASLQEYSSRLLKQLMEITNATMSVFYILEETATKFEHIASIGANKKLLKSFNAQNPEGEIGNAVSKKDIYYLRDIPENTVFKYKTIAGDANPKEIITIPVMENNIVIALISLVNVHRFTEESYTILNQSWASINTSYSSLLANEKTNSLAENLANVNQELESQTEELQVQAAELQQTTEELKEQNIELELQKTELDEASRLKTSFLSNMSHELRTPLNSVIALSGVLNRRLFNQIPKEEYSYLGIIQRNGKHLLSLINDILDISRIESGREEIVITEFDVNGLISELVDMLHPQAEQKNIELIQIEANTELPITSDISKCKHILQNLIANAVKFTDTGKVEITVKKMEDTVTIAVIDTGIGISKKMIPHIFDEFHQVDSTTSRRFEGTGLGLTIAKKYATMLGGLISVKSTVGKGSEFTFTLPLTYTDENGKEEAAKTNYKFAKEQIQDKLNSDASGKTILLVDDNEPVIIQVKIILEEIGYKILIARDGAEAIEIIGNTIPDGIVLDLMMPKVDGFQVLKSLRDSKRTEHVPVLILTAKHLSKEELKFLKQNNVHQLIQKGDIKRNEFLIAISRMVFPEIEIKMKEQPKRVIQNIKGKPVVLVVEDNPDNMTTIKAMLAENHTAIEAIDGEKAVKMARKHVPDLILMDIALPKMDGYQAFKAIRAMDELQHIPIVAITASAMTQDREKMLEFGFDAYIAKPIDDRTFYKTIDKMLYGK